MDTTQKLNKLRELIAGYGSVVVAFSGGVDSTFLAKIASDVLGPKALSITAVSETYTSAEYEEAIRFAGLLGINHSVVNTNELENELFSSNPPERCYYCKKELFQVLQDIARAEGYNVILDGANIDDLKDFRPGSKAGEESGVKKPLVEVGLTKEEIRELSRQLGLPSWEKPSMACLASRIPYGTKISRENLERVQKSEQFLNSLGYSPVRVRDYGHTARIEFLADQMVKAVTIDKDLILDNLNKLGYTYITLDLGGFRSGSMNEVLNKETT